jgi:hypothetical protein
MPRFAQIDGNTVTAILIAKAAPQEPPFGRMFVQLNDDEDVQGGEIYDGVTFTKPPKPPVVVTPTIGERLTAIETKLDALLAK